MISFISMTQGNPIALKRTLESFKDICDEFIIGDVIVFEEDRKIIESYKQEYNIKIIKYPFNFIYKNGFSCILNNLASYAKNDLVIYMNVGEVIDGEQRTLRLISEKFPEFNCYAINHGVEKHTWVRIWDKRFLKWDGILHEEVVSGIAERNLCPYYVFQFKDTEKDSVSELKAKVYNDIKEIVYFNQYIRLVEDPGVIGITNDWWLNFAKDNYDSMKQRLNDKRERHEAFKEGDLEKYMNDIKTNPIFEKERFNSSNIVEFQGSFKSL